MDDTSATICVCVNGCLHLHTHTQTILSRGSDLNDSLGGHCQKNKRKSLWRGQGHGINYMTQDGRQRTKHILKETIKSIYTAFSLSFPPVSVREVFVEVMADMYHVLRSNTSGLLLFKIRVQLYDFVLYKTLCMVQKT